MAPTDIEFELKANASDFKRELNNAKIFARDTRKELNRELLANLELKVADFQLKLDQARKDLREAKKENDKNATITAQLRVNELQRGLTESKRQLNNYVNTGDKSLSRLQAKFNQVTDEIKASRDELIKLGKNTKALDSILAKMDDVEKSFKEGKITIGEYSKQMGVLKKQADNTGKSFSGFRNILVSLAGLGLLQTFRNLTSATFNLSSGLEQAQVAFTSLLGSASAANKLLNDLADFAKVTPFELVGIRQTAKQLLAFGFQADEIIPTLDKLGNVAAGLSVPIEQIATAYGQVRTANQLYGTELRQFVNAGVPLLKQLSDQFGVTESEAKKLVETGKVSFKDVELAFAALTEEGGLFANQLENQSKTVAGLLSNVRDTINIIAESIGSKFLPAISGALNRVLSFTEKFPGLTKVIAVTTTALIGLSGVVAVLSPAVGSLTSAFVALRTALSLTAIATFLTGPAGIAIGAVAALGGAVFVLRKELGLVKEETDEVSESQKKLNDLTDSYIKRIDEVKDKQKRLNKEFKEGKLGNEEYKKAIDATGKALENLESRQVDVQKALDIIDDKQKDYIQRINEINNLELDTSDYDVIIGRLQEIQQEQLKAIRLEQKLLRAKIEAEKVTPFEEEVAESGIAVTGPGATLLGARSILNRLPEGFDPFKISTQAQEEVENLTKELSTLEEQEKKVLDLIREGQDIIEEEVKTRGQGGRATQESTSAEVKAERERQEKILREQALADIREINQSNKTELEKAEAVIKINEKLNEDLKKLREDQNTTDVRLAAESSKKILEEEEKKQKEILKLEEESNKKIRTQIKNEESLQKESAKIFDEVIKEREKRVDDFEKKLLELNKSIEGINEELQKLEEDRGTTLGERNVEILEDEKKIREELTTLQREGVDLSKAQRIGEQTLRQLGAGTIGGQDVQDLLQAVELNNELNRLIEEKRLISANATDEELKEQKRLAELSPTARFLEEFATRKAILEEERELKRQEIADLELQKENELTILETFRQDKEEIDQQYRDSVALLEAQITDDLQQEVDRRKEILEDLRADIAQTKAELESLSIQSAETASQVIQSQNNFGDITIQNEVDADSLINRLRP